MQWVRRGPRQLCASTACKERRYVRGSMRRKRRRRMASCAHCERRCMTHPAGTLLCVLLQAWQGRTKSRAGCWPGHSAAYMAYRIAHLLRICRTSGTFGGGSPHARNMQLGPQVGQRPVVEWQARHIEGGALHNERPELAHAQLTPRTPPQPLLPFLHLLPPLSAHGRAASHSLQLRHWKGRPKPERRG